MIGLQREPAFVTDLFERGGDGREINGHGERDLVGIVPTIVIVNVKRLQAVAQRANHIRCTGAGAAHFRVADVEACDEIRVIYGIDMLDEAL